MNVTYPEFLTYLFDRDQTKELAVELAFLVGLAISTAITLVRILFGYTVEDPALLLGSSLGLWVGMFGSWVIAVRTKGTGSLADLGLVKPQWVDVALGAGFAVAGVIM